MLRRRTNQAGAGRPERMRALRLFKTWFWRPPRPHGDTIIDRRVTPLEALYDLVYAAVIAQAGIPLARDVSLGNLIEFTIVFSLTWIAWINGSLYYEIHGRTDGRSRALVFLQIGILATLAAFASDAGGSTGRGFAVAYALLMILMTWLWYEVRRQDVIASRQQFVADAGRYVAAMAVSAVVILVSGFLPPFARLAIWAAVSIGWVLLLLVMGRSQAARILAMIRTESLVERFGLFTIIVLGEVVFSVVEGLSRTPHDLTTVATGMVGLLVGFGFWWIYFDVVGGKLPRGEDRAVAIWIVAHYPVTLSIAAAGVGMVSLLERAHEGNTPSSTAWLLSGAAALGMLAVVVISHSLAESSRLTTIYRQTGIALAMGAVASLIIGLARPVPWLFGLLLSTVMVLVWAVAVRGFLLTGAWEPEHQAR
ncbi:MAG TPA: low temperature requirement protein A [Candidatus Dormibacteraeota bacterium]|nr:low temperature requirement protein A [Candidatus Dormibacteraeota bacterium]